jgi:hypothetical protein
MAAFAAVIVVAHTALADPPKPNLQLLGSRDAALSHLDDKTVTIKQVEFEPKTGGSISRSGRVTLPKLQPTEKEYEFELAADVLFRRLDLPKGPDGKVKRFTNAEYAQLREPLSAPGFKADRGDFKPGQQVRLYLARTSSREKPFVTTIMIIKDQPEMPKKQEPMQQPKADPKAKTPPVN